MNVIFAGTPEFAAVSLRAILAAGHTVTLVLTQPDRPAGRGLRLTPSPVKLLAQQAALPILQPASLRDPAVQAQLASYACDVMVVAAYGLILPPPVLALPARACINVHASLLPRWRGAAPIQRAILAGDATSGVSIMAMEAGLDTGPVYRSAAVPLADGETAQTLHDKLAEVGARELLEVLAALARGNTEPVAQTAEGVCYAAKIEKSEALLDWRLPAAVLHRQVRAFDPFPGALTGLFGAALKVWAAKRPDQLLHAPVATPGEVLAVGPGGIQVACGEGQLLVTELQKSGGRRLPVSDFLAGQPIAVASRLG